MNYHYREGMTMKYVRLVAVVFVVTVIMTAMAWAAVVDRIVAIVNKDVITLSELNRNVESYMKRIEASAPEGQRDEIEKQVRRMVLNELIDQLLVMQKAKERGLRAADREVDNAINNILSQRKITLGDMKSEVERLGGTFEEYREEVRDHLTKRNFVGAEVRSKITVTKEEIGTYYREHLKEYEGKEAVRIKQILIIRPRNGDHRNEEAAREKVGKALQKLKEGVSFSVLAAEVSQGPAAKAGGDLGFLQKGLMFPEVEKVAFNLNIGEISDVIESQVGFHIIQVVDKRGEGVKPIESVKEEIIETIGNKKVEKKFEEWLIEERKRSHIEVKL
jgi:peptidyl-prolyl cis-trans isomerase SurA